ncbi:MAG: hypothetical protein ACXVAN_12520, partial [Polyangia bacterium]
MDKTSLVKVFLHDRGQDVESAWCQPVADKGGTALFRLVNVPFLHEKPTFGDVIPAVRAEDGNWEWDRGGASDKRVGERLHSDGGRYALIVDYTMRTDADFGALINALEKKHDVIGEGCFGPRGEEPGRLYLAAPRTMDAAAVMEAVTRLGRGFRFVLVHPTPKKPSKSKSAKTKKPTAKKRPTKKSAAAGKKP